jgi:hypothetical protein
MSEMDYLQQEETSLITLQAMQRGKRNRKYQSTVPSFKFRKVKVFQLDHRPHSLFKVYKKCQSSTIRSNKVSPKKQKNPLVTSVSFSSKQELDHLSAKPAKWKRMENVCGIGT